MLLSGPAGGVVAALALGEALGVADLITFDMGGTSADFSVVREGRAATVRDRDFDGLPLRVPMLEIKAISAGGGSIGSVDRGGGLRVGPASAGAVPGPACYARGGTEPTLTDAALVLGMLEAETFAGGEIGLDPERAREAIGSRIAAPLGLSIEAAALGMLEVATASTAQAIRELSTERGDDVAGFSLLAFGGAGGLNAYVQRVEERTRPRGGDGGEPGGLARVALNPGTDAETALPSKAMGLRLDAGTVIRLQSSGGGGLGDPAERSPERARRDRELGYTTR